MTAAQRHREAVLRRDGELCALSRLGPCAGRLQAHHIIPQVRLKAAHSLANTRPWVVPRLYETMQGVDLDDLIADGRNGIALCERHHQRPGEVRAEDLPPEVFAFAADYGLIWSLERDFDLGPDGATLPGSTEPPAGARPVGSRAEGEKESR